jgi:pimeloyl-ACP methyl ester carboxylesterase
VTPGAPEPDGPVRPRPPAPRAEGVVRLHDGRRLAYAEYGADSPRTVIYFHGLPSSRLEAALTDAGARALGLRILSPDRPGMGGASFQPGRRITDWPSDVEQLAAALGLGRFGVMGTSGGGPYALACAAALPAMVSAAVLLAGLGRVAESDRTIPYRGFTRFFLGLARRAPWCLPAVCAPVSLGLRTKAPDLYLRRFALGLCGEDRRVLKDPLVRGAMLGAFRESASAGHRGPCHDLRIAVRPWGFSPESIGVPVHLYHGEDDSVVPHAMSEELADLVPGARLHLLPGEGHYSLPVRQVYGALGLLAESL